MGNHSIAIVVFVLIAYRMIEKRALTPVKSVSRKIEYGLRINYNSLDSSSGIQCNIDNIAMQYIGIFVESGILRLLDHFVIETKELHYGLC